MDTTSTKTDKKQMKMQFLQDLVTAYGEGSVITHKQMMAVWTKNQDQYPHVVRS